MSPKWNKGSQPNHPNRFLYPFYSPAPQYTTQIEKNILQVRNDIKLWWRTTDRPKLWKIIESLRVWDDVKLLSPSKQVWHDVKLQQPSHSNPLSSTTSIARYTATVYQNYIITSNYRWPKQAIKLPDNEQHVIKLPSVTKLPYNVSS